MNIDEYIADVNRPGKFEGEPPWTPYYYEQSLEGIGEWVDGPEWDDTKLMEFVVNDEESKAFELIIGQIVLLWEDSQGFVRSFICVDESERDQFINDFYGVEP